MGGVEGETHLAEELVDTLSTSSFLKICFYFAAERRG